MASNVQSKKFAYGWIILAAVVFILLTSFVIFLFLHLRKKQKEDLPPEDDDQVTTLEFINLVNSTLALDETNAKILTAHSMHETGVFTSRVFINDLNSFGMKHPVTRETLSTGSDISGYAIYDSLADSIKDLKLWFDYHNQEINFDSVDSYVQFLKDKSYFTASFITFNKAVKQHFNAI